MFKIDFKNTLLLGLLFVSPMTITVWVLYRVVSFLDQLFYDFVPLEFSRIPGSGLLTAVLVLFVAGLLAKSVMGRFLKNIIDMVMERVPIMRGLYKLMLQLSDAFLGDGQKKAFRKVVIVPFPNRETRALAFVTGELPSGEVLVFMPTAPNPTSGYVLAFKPEDVKEEKMSVDEAIKIIVSCGATRSG